MFKKKNFKFMNNRISRDFRHAETLKARESSRFKHLSMLRSVGDSMEARETSKPSRVEMLQKWKEEKLMKKQLDMKLKKKPFYAGCSTGSQLSSLQFRSILKLNQPAPLQQPKVPSNRKLLNQPAPLQQPKVPSNRKLVPPSTYQNSRIPNDSRMGNSARSVAGGIKPPLSKITPTSNLESSNESCTSKVTTQGLVFHKSTFSKPSKPVQKNITARKRVPDKISATGVKQEQSTNMMSTPKHDLFKVPKTIEFKGKIESMKEDLLLEQSLENIPDITLNCDLSVIKTEASFAPFDFEFQPPAGLSAFLFDDTCKVAVNKNLKFMSRASTPTREAHERASDHFSKTHKSSIGKDCPLINKKDSSPKASDDLANEILNDIDNLFKIVLDNEELPISETPDILINNETFEEEEELIIKEDLCEKSPRKFLENEDFEQKLNDLVAEMSANVQAEESALSQPETPYVNQFKQVIKSQMQSVKLEQEKQDKGDIATEKELKKSTGGAISKGVSVHRKSVLQSIAETSEADKSSFKSPMKNVKSQNSPCTPRRSSRLSAKKSQVFDDQSTAKEDPVLITPVAPMQHSQQLLKHIPKSLKFNVLSPFKGKRSSYFNFTHCRSVRLIDLSTDLNESRNTPEKSESASFIFVAKTNITADFEKLALNSNENIDPNGCLIDFESSPDPVFK